MFNTLFYELKAARLPVSLREYLTLLEAMDARVVHYSVDDFYYLSRASLVKDERNLDRFDQVFGHVFKGLEPSDNLEEVDIPAEWLQKLNEKFLTDAEKAEIEALGGWEKLMETLRQRLEEQKGRHQVQKRNDYKNEERRESIAADASGALHFYNRCCCPVHSNY